MHPLVAKVRAKFEARGLVGDPDALARESAETLETAPRDEFGFVEGPVPHLTEEQFVWLSYRLGLETDAQACLVSGVEDEVAASWMRVPGFAAVCRIALGNKREGFKLLIAHLNPKGLRVISQLLDSSSLPAQRVGLNALLRAQGLLIDQHKRTDLGAIEQLIAQLRAPGKPYVASADGVRALGAADDD